MTAIPPEAVTAAAEALHRTTCEWDLDECVADHIHDRAATEALEAAAPHLAAAERGKCCDLHGRNCEPPSELCCENCTEGDHPAHRQSGPCSSPNLSPDTLAEAAKIDAAVAAERERWRQLAATMPAQEFRDCLIADECGQPTILGGLDRPCQMPSGHDGPHLRKPVPLDQMRGHRE